MIIDHIPIKFLKIPYLIISILTVGLTLSLSLNIQLCINYSLFKMSLNINVKNEKKKKKKKLKAFLRNVKFTYLNEMTIDKANLNFILL